MRRRSPQGYSGRKISQAGAGGPRGSPGGPQQSENIWEVVSSLASALQNARNQLVNLMSTSRSNPLRVYGGRANEPCESRVAHNTPNVSPSRGIRNVHRGHARGHVAFGMHTEFPLHAATTMRGRRARPKSAQRPVRAEAAACPPRRCTHPLHHMRAAARSLTPRRGMQATRQSSQGGDCRKSHREEPRERGAACINISSVKDQTKRGCASDQMRHGHCMGPQFISLLKQEAHQIRERRLAGSLRNRRPSWSRY